MKAEGSAPTWYGEHYKVSWLVLIKQETQPLKSASQWILRDF